VEIAYDELAARELVHVVPGRGAIVRRTIPAEVELALPFPEPRARDPLPTSAWREPEPPDAAGGSIDFRGDSPAPLVLPTASLRAFLRRALETRGPIAGPPAAGGESVLRDAASRVFAAAGVLRPASEIAVFPDLGDAVAAVLDLFVPKHGVVLADALLQPRVVGAVRRAGARLVVLDEEAGEHALRRATKSRPRLLVVPSRQSGIPRVAASAARRRMLLDFAREEGVPILEDLTRSPAAPIEPDAPPLAVLDRSGRVISLVDLGGEVGGGFDACAIATTAKAMERLRTGTSGRAHPLDRIAARVLAAALDSPTRTRLHRRLHESRALLASSLARGIRRRLEGLRGLEFSSDTGFVRLDLPANVSASALAAAAAARGVHVLLPHDCGAPPSDDDFVLLDLGRHEEGELLEGIRLLGAAFDDARRDAPLTARSPEREAAPS
jgi:DNA-binding transcriptional MocR family regulator